MYKNVKNFGEEERKKAKDLESEIEKFDKAAIHWIFTIGVSAITALITTLALLK